MVKTTQFAPKNLQKRRQNGFTLVELAIVLIIAALIIGGALAGQNLVRASELRSVATERDQLRMAVNSFYDRYRGIPGDVKNFTNYFATAANGNGNGQVDYDERLLYWQQLSASGLVDGAYTGTLSGASAFVPGTNIPLTDSGSNGWSIYVSWWQNTLDGQSYTLQILSNTEAYAEATSPGNPQVAVMPKGDFLPSEAWNIDTKIDDGSPVKGEMIAYSAGEKFTDPYDGRGCIDTAGPQANSKYLVTDEAVGGVDKCFVGFKKDEYISSRDPNPVWWPGYVIP